MIDCLIYFVVFAVVFALNTIAAKQLNPKVRRPFIIISFIILLVFIGFRYNVGTDYNAYLEVYKSMQNTPWERLSSMRTEFLVVSLFKVCSYILWDARLIFVVLGFLLLFPIYRANKLYDYRYLPYSVLTFCVLFLPFGLNGMRQGIAMGFTLLAVLYFVKNRPKRGILSFVISVLFHTSAWIVLPYLIAIYVCRRWNFNFTRISVILTVLIAAAVLFFLNDLLMENGITQYNYMLGQTDVEKISIKSIVVYLPIIVMALLLKYREDEKEEFLVMKNMTISGICLFVVGTSAQYLSRFGLYFMMPSIILLPELLINMSSEKKRIIVKMLFIIYMAGFFVTQYVVLGRHDIVPYQNWLFSANIIENVDNNRRIA